MKFACEVCWDYDCNCTESEIQEHREKSKSKVHAPIEKSEISDTSFIKDINNATEWLLIKNIKRISDDKRRIRAI